MGLNFFSFSDACFNRMTPRAAYAISLEYQHDFDEHGLFYYIGNFHFLLLKTSCCKGLLNNICFF